MFYENMLTFRHNRKIVDLPKNINADYYTSDYDPFLIYDKNLELLREYAPDIENFTEFHLDCKAIFKAKQKISADDRILYNYMSWLCLVEKGKLMLEAYQKEIMPQIEEVFDLQKKITITNDVGDSITGSIDVTLSFIDEPGVKYIVDNKSSSKPYKEDSVIESAQLATYCEAEGTNKAAYIVIEKKVYRRLPFVHTQVIRNIIPEETFVKTFDNFEKMVYSVQSEKFEKNEDSCFAFGKRCEYWDLCKKGSIRGLVKVLDET